MTKADKKQVMNKCIGVSILLAILTFWLSESLVRLPEIARIGDKAKWSGWVKVINGEGEARQKGGPIYTTVAWMRDVFRERIYWRYRKWVMMDATYPTDRFVLIAWTVFCVLIGTIVGLLRIKKDNKSQTVDASSE